jgi:multidrug efflux pump subunit AcrB
LERPFTVLVAVIALGLVSVVGWRRMPKDILPVLDVPTIYVAQTYGGMDPAQMEGYLVYFFEYHFLYITGIEHVESKSIQGASVMKLQFHPGTDMAQAMAETVAFVNRARAFMPPGTMPPFITRLDPGSVPVGYLVFSSEGDSVGEAQSITEMQDAALNRVRPLLATLPGVSAPPPFGGNARTIVVNLDPERLKSYRMSPDEVVQAVAAANVVSPSGNVKMGGRYPMVPVNSVAARIEDLRGAPVRGGEYPAVFVRDVAEVVDGSDIVTGYALVNGRRTVYVPVTKRAEASSLAVARMVKGSLGKFQAVLPAGMRVSFELDRSPAIGRALAGVQWEALLGGLLAGAVTLIFLRDWRSAMVVVVNIPIALAAAVFGLWLGGQTLNLMTLGGLALAVGILVDESIVCLENIHAHVGRGRGMEVSGSALKTSVAQSALQGTLETTGPRLLAMLCVLILFTPALFMSGVIKAMFLPLALAVGFAVAGSYVLSSTLVPVLAVLAFGKGGSLGGAPNGTGGAPVLPIDWFETVRERYGGLMGRLLRGGGGVVVAYFVGSVLLIAVGSRWLGSEIFPKVNSGEVQLRIRAPSGTDIEHTEAIVLKALRTVEKGVGQIEFSLGFVGLHGSTYPINFLYLWDGGPEEAVLQFKCARSFDADALRKRLIAEIPEAEFSIEPADIVSQVMGLGAAAPIEVAVRGPNLANDRAFADKVKRKLEGIPELRDVQFAQSFDYPTVEVAVDRVRSGVIGADMTDVSRALVPTTWSSRFQVPNFWADPRSGISYQVQTQIPQERTRSLEDIGNLTVAEVKAKPVLLRNVARVSEGSAPSQFDRFDMQRTVTVRANVGSGGLDEAARKVTEALRDLGTPPARVSVAVRGQVAPMMEMRGALLRGLVVAVIAIVLLLLAHFQSWRLALVVCSVTPAVLTGVVVALWLTGSHWNMQSFMGLIMAISVAVANAILLVTFAERARMGGLAGGSTGVGAREAALESARTRLRPILMTSAAMLGGMMPVAIGGMPLALGLSDGTGQLAPLGRAVVGGLMGGTLCTLLVLPRIFAGMMGRAHTRGVSLFGEVTK